MSYQDQMALLQEKRRELRALEAQAERTARSMQPITEKDERELMDWQARSDAAYRAAGRMGSPAPMNFERPAEYQRRLVEGIAAHSSTWARADFSKMPDEAFQIARDQVLAEVAANAKAHGLKSTEIRELPSSSNAGHWVVEFAGGENAWFGNVFRRTPRLAVFQQPEAYAAMSRDGQLARVSEVVRTMRPPMQAPRVGF
jgi:hypothetical protein